MLFGFLLPAGILLEVALSSSGAKLDARLLGQIANSITVSGVTAVIAVAVATLIAYAARLAKRPLVTGASRAAALGYAIPGAVIAVGILVPLGRLDNLLADWIQVALGTDVGLVFTGTIAALVYAYLVRFLAVALQTVEAGLAKVTPSMEDAARSLGLGPARTLARVHAPLAGVEPRDRGAAGVRRCDEGAAGDVRAAAVQLRHARGRRLQLRAATSGSRRPRSRRW